MDSWNDKDIEQLLERSRSLIREAQELKRVQEELLRDFEGRQARPSTDNRE
jgi:hypothetical protein